MSPKKNASIQVRVANEHNLQGVSLDIPHKQFVVVTGVSGSGKSSLTFDVIAREGQRRYLETFPSFSRQFMGKLTRPDVEAIEGLSPVIAIGQKTTGGSIRSTVGTLSDLYALLRLLFARLGESPDAVPLNRGLFSFNGAGVCPQCHGLGLEERIAQSKVIADSTKTLREGALAPTLPNGYIMYSQVTVDVLNDVCQAHGFDVDTPWEALSAEQQDIVWNGSTRLKVPFGKHSLESRLKWTGITAKPREEGYYRGMIPIMSEILRRDRNKNILRYVESVECSDCAGSRLKHEARAVQLKGTSIVELSQLEVSELRKWLEQTQWNASQKNTAEPIVAQLVRQIELFEKLGIGYLSLNRAAPGLSGGEAQRIRLINQLSAELSDVLYVFDEPSIGLHPADNQNLLEVLRMLVENGNSLLVVEHDEATIRQADWIIDIGPGAGVGGGKVLYNGNLESFLLQESLRGVSPTFDFLHSPIVEQEATIHPGNAEFIEVPNCRVHNLKGFDARFQLGALNVITGLSGAGKSSLMEGCLRPFASEGLATETVFSQVISIDQKPIGRTPRSNPATYTGLADGIRDLFAKLPVAKSAGFNKSRFSFNTKGGRCETCEGAGAIQIGMHFLGNVQVTCGTCAGLRFNAATLAVKYKDKNIAQILDLSVAEALVFFEGEPKLKRILSTIDDLGLGYIKLGQPSTTLSGGEAQRIKLATQLQQKTIGSILYLLDEPTVGLHGKDVDTLIKALQAFCALGHTVVCVEHDPLVIRQSQWVVDLGPGRGVDGGELLFQGTPELLKVALNSLTGQALIAEPKPKRTVLQPKPNTAICLQGVHTHRLKNISVEIPKGQLTVITGVSGSGKSSLAFHTLFAEGQSRFTESLSTYARSQLQQANPAQFESSSGLGPVVAIGRKYLSRSPRSTVGTMSGIYDHLRLLYSRLAQLEGHPYTAQHFSFNHQLGACPQCDGLGVELTCDPEVLIAHPEKSILDGAIGDNKIAQFYGDPHGRYMALLKAVDAEKNLGLHHPWNELAPETKEIVLHGTGERVWEVTWQFRNKTRSGEQQIAQPWLGFSGYIDDEYQRKHQNKNTRNLQDLMHEKNCALCAGARLKQELLAVQLAGVNLAQLTQMPVTDCIGFLKQQLQKSETGAKKALLDIITRQVLPQLEVIKELGLDYLTLARKARTLSGGEGQRLRLAGQLAAQLYGVTYVLDEPTIGLHPDNVKDLLQVLKRILALGNTLVVVEHDEQVIRQADHVLELGPGSGAAGGEVVFAGKLNDLLKSKQSVTAPYLLNPALTVATPRKNSGQKVEVTGAFANNLQHIDVQWSVGTMVALTGVSGSGKTSLLREVIYQSARTGTAKGCKDISGLEHFAQVQLLDQQAWSGSTLSTPATYLGWMDALRDLFAKTDAAKRLGLKKGAFSFNHKEGKCPECGGAGYVKTALDFMGDVFAICESCNGLRFAPASLEVTYRGYSIGALLQLTISEALEFFESPALQQPLHTLIQVGLGHLSMGQSTNTLSGGEAQRLKLACELMQPQKGSTLYLLDEPTTGLHFKDIEQLGRVLNDLVEQGHTVMFVEHNAQLIALANEQISLGPGGGGRGGRLLSGSAGR